MDNKCAIRPLPFLSTYSQPYSPECDYSQTVTVPDPNVQNRRNQFQRKDTRWFPIKCHPPFPKVTVTVVLSVHAHEDPVPTAAAVAASSKSSTSQELPKQTSPLHHSPAKTCRQRKRPDLCGTNAEKLPPRGHSVSQRFHPRFLAMFYENSFVTPTYLELSNVRSLSLHYHLRPAGEHCRDVIKTSGFLDNTYRDPQRPLTRATLHSW